MSRRIRLLVWLAGALIVVAAGIWLVGAFGLPFRTHTEIGSAVLVDADLLEITVGCGSDVSTTVEETGADVIMTVRMRFEAGDCATGEVVQLLEPLDDRRLIDGSTGEEVEVSGRDSRPG